MFKFKFIVVICALVMPFSQSVFAQEIAQAWEVHGTSPADTAKVASIIEARFKGIKPHFYNSVSSTLTNNIVTVRFSGWQPTSKQTDFLLHTVGKLRITLELRFRERELLLTENDIEDAGFLRNPPQLALRLNDAASKRITARAQNMTGQTIDVIWDGRLVNRLRIAEPLKKDISLTALSEDDAQLMSVVLRTGILPNGATLTPR